MDNGGGFKLTAEIAIMNKNGVALATDSAGTVIGPRGIKINKSQNKLFMLSKYEPVGIMIYNSTDFMDIPWETIIKLYRDRLGQKKFSSLTDYVANLFKFIEFTFIGKDEDQKNYFQEQIRYKFATIKRILTLNDPDFTLDMFRNFLDKHSKELKKDENDLGLFAQFCLTTFCKNLYEDVTLYWKGISQEFIDDILAKYGDIIEQEIEKLKKSKGILIPEDCNDHLQNIAIYAFYENATGIVISGFGEDEIYPSIFSYTVGGAVDCKLKKKLHEEETHFVNRENPAQIIPFAQHEMVDTFLEGVTPFFQTNSEDYLEKIFEEYPEDILEILKKIKTKDIDEKTLDFVKEKIEEIKGQKTNMILDYQKAMEKFKTDYKIPMLISIINYQKDELALMAESMVHITSLKRKVSFDEAETVGGAIDVAVISKGDGFVWIKRKHYFKPELNHHFFNKYYPLMKKR